MLALYHNHFNSQTWINFFAHIFPYPLLFTKLHRNQFIESIRSDRVDESSTSWQIRINKDIIRSWGWSRGTKSTRNLNHNPTWSYLIFFLIPTTEGTEQARKGSRWDRGGKRTSSYCGVFIRNKVWCNDRWFPCNPLFTCTSLPWSTLLYILLMLSQNRTANEAAVHQEKVTKELERTDLSRWWQPVKFKEGNSRLLM